jgi:hypothetical protein
MKLLDVDSLAVAEDKGLLSEHYNMLTLVIIVIVVLGLFLILRRRIWDKKGRE